MWPIGSLRPSVAASISLLAASIFPLPNTLTAADEPTVAKACALAYVDFKRHLRVDVDTTTDFGRFMSDADNYRITIEASRERIEVRFSPKDFNSEIVRGGSYIYTIDATGVHIDNLQMTR